MATKRVLNIGHCLADHTGISLTLRQHFDAEVVPADTREESLGQLRQGGFDLVLVNRVLDGDGSSGLEFIKALRADDVGQQVPIMLVSNYEDAQRAAVDAGAVPGFGKGALGHPAMIARLRKYLSD
jgi:DNA-binding response OmpR family regulator